VEQQQHSVHDPHDEMRRLLQLPHGGDVGWFNGLQTRGQTVYLRGSSGNTQDGTSLVLFNTVPPLPPAGGAGAQQVTYPQRATLSCLNSQKP